MWFEKKGVPADFPFEDTADIRRGRALESVAFDVFCQKYDAAGDNGVAHHTMPGKPFIGVHVDRLFVAPGIDQGVLEIKVPTVFNWRNIKRHDAAPQTWIAQVQWGMMTTGIKHGALAVFNPDAFDVLRFDVEPDKGMQDSLVQIAEVFWDSLTLDENPADKLPDGDARCYSCRWRTTCKGIGANVYDPDPKEIQEIIDLGGFVPDSTPRLVNIVNLWEESKADAREADKYKEELKTELMSLLKGPQVLMLDGRKIVRTETVVNVKAHTQRRVNLNIVK